MAIPFIAKPVGYQTIKPLSTVRIAKENIITTLAKILGAYDKRSSTERYIFPAWQLSIGNHTLELCRAKTILVDQKKITLEFEALYQGGYTAGKASFAAEKLEEHLTDNFARINASEVSFGYHLIEEKHSGNETIWFIRVAGEIECNKKELTERGTDPLPMIKSLAHRDVFFDLKQAPEAAKFFRTS